MKRLLMALVLSLALASCQSQVNSTAPQPPEEVVEQEPPPVDETPEIPEPLPSVFVDYTGCEGLFGEQTFYFEGIDKVVTLQPDNETLCYRVDVGDNWPGKALFVTYLVGSHYGTDGVNRFVFQLTVDDVQYLEWTGGGANISQREFVFRLPEVRTHSIPSLSGRELPVSGGYRNELIFSLSSTQNVKLGITGECEVYGTDYRYSEYVGLSVGVNNLTILSSNVSPYNNTRFSCALYTTPYSLDGESLARLGDIIRDDGLNMSPSLTENRAF